MPRHDVIVSEDPLQGGWANSVVRVGDTVRRTPPARAEFVRNLLTFFAEAGWDGAPRFLGIDEQGRDILDYVAGHVAWQAGQPPGVVSEESLIRVATMVRTFHDLTAGSALADGAEVVCHNDLSPKNTVYRDVGYGLRPVAFIDWDLSAPGRRIHDVAFVCWQYLDPRPGVDGVDATVDGIRLLCDGYGLAHGDRGELIDTVLWWQDRCWRGIEAAARAGDASGLKLSEAGVIGEVQSQWQWFYDNHDRLRAGLQRRGF